MEKTLEELKKENEKEEAGLKPDGKLEGLEGETPGKDEREEIEEPEPTKDEEPELDEDGNPIKEPEPEPWQESDEEKTKDGVPVATDIRVKQKLKGRISEREDEIATLKTEIETLKKGIGAPSTIELPKRPKVDDYETDEEYQVALDEYDDKVTAARFERIEQKQELKKRQRQSREVLEKDLESHYERAEKLVTESGIDPGVYKKTDEIFRHTIEAVRPKEGDLIADQLISILGKGSEKVVFFVGRNEGARDKIKALLVEDPSGMKLTAYLGQEKGRLSAPKPRISQAPKPSAQLKGDVVPNNGAGLKRKYDDAHTKGNIQTAYNLKKEAKKSGVDVSQW